MAVLMVVCKLVWSCWMLEMKATKLLKHWKVELSQIDVDCPEGLMDDVDCPKGLIIVVDCPKGWMDFCMVNALDLVLETH